MWVGEGWTDRFETMKLSCSCLAVTHRSHDICVKICRLYKMNKDLFVSCGVWMKNNACMGPWMTPRHHYWPCWCFFFFLPPDFSCLRVSHSSDSSFLLKSESWKKLFLIHMSHFFPCMPPKLIVVNCGSEVVWAGEVALQVERLAGQTGSLSLICSTHKGEGETQLLQGVLGCSQACCGVNRYSVWLYKPTVVVGEGRVSEGMKEHCRSSR